MKTLDHEENVSRWIFRICSDYTESELVAASSIFAGDAKLAAACVLMACESNERHAEPDGTGGSRQDYGLGESGPF